MRAGNIAQIILFTIAISATFYAVKEGMTQYHEIRVK